MNQSGTLSSTRGCFHVKGVCQHLLLRYDVSFQRTHQAYVLYSLVRPVEGKDQKKIEGKLKKIEKTTPTAC